MQPLKGVKVIELARILAGPWAGQLLADLGAEVIKVEHPHGDDTRQWGPPFIGEDAAYFHATNRGKTSVALDFTTDEGRNALLNLLKDADILIENFKVGGLKKYGLDYETLKKLFPRLLYCSITGFGQTGPKAALAGYDFMIQGESGIMDLTGEANGAPQKMGVAFADIFTGTYSVTGLLASLYAREKTGQGAHLDMALLDTQISVLANQGMNYLVSGVSPKRMGNAHPNLVPYQVFKVQDGHMIIASGNDGQYEKLMIVLGLPLQPQFKTNALRVENRVALAAFIEEATLKWERDALIKALEAVFVPCGAINSVAQAFNQPQVQARGMVQMLEGIPTIASPIVINGERMMAKTPSPPKPFLAK
jgi:crotonobetainyl-CoA:carnitine CoA-transferase CaiB-like acyl-CoA transferase